MSTTVTPTIREAILARTIRKAQAGDLPLVYKFAQRTLDRAAGGNVTVLPVEAEAAEFLGLPQGSARHEELRWTLASKLLRGLEAQA